MPGMHCDQCGGLFEYREQIVALRETGTAVVAEHETELEAGTVEGAFQPACKFHLRCYETMRGLEPGNWPELNPTS